MTLSNEGRLLETERISTFTLSSADYEIIASCNLLTDSIINRAAFMLAVFVLFFLDGQYADYWPSSVGLGNAGIWQSQFPMIC